MPIMNTYYAILPVGYTDEDYRMLEQNVNDERLKDECLYKSEDDAIKYIVFEMQENSFEYHIVKVFEKTICLVEQP